MLHFNYGRTSMARTPMARLPRLFRLESLGKKSIAAGIIIFGIILGNFLIILIMVCCVFSLELPRRGNSNENKQHSFIIKKIEKISLLCQLTWRYD